jgi:hypothetical protein
MSKIIIRTLWAISVGLSLILMIAGGFGTVMAGCMPDKEASVCFIISFPSCFLGLSGYSLLMPDSRKIIIKKVKEFYTK